MLLLSHLVTILFSDCFLDPANESRSGKMRKSGWPNARFDCPSKTRRLVDASSSKKRCDSNNCCLAIGLLLQWTALVTFAHFKGKKDQSVKGVSSRNYIRTVKVKLTRAKTSYTNDFVKILDSTDFQLS